MKRAAGILMPISSLPSPHGVGTLGKAAYRFAEFLRGAGCSIWQVLPLQPTSFGNSPYQSCAAEALNPYFIDLDFLVRDGLLTKEEVLSADGDETRVDYGGLYRTRIPLLKRAFARFNGKEPAWQAFLEKGEYRDYAIFAALKEEFGGAPFWEWGEYADYDGEKIARFEQTHSEEVQFLLFTQFLFLTQWRTLFVIAIAVPQFVTLLLMQKILDADGIFNVILGLTGNDKILWLGDSSHWAIIPRVTIIVVNMWIGIPYTILMCTGILMNIPSEMYEAARLDGASPFQVFRKIVLPYMLHVTAPYLITQFVGNINNFNVIWLLSGGGPIDNINYGAGSKAQATDLLVTWLYRLTTDVNPQYNLASVIGIIIFLISAALALITFNRSKANKNEEDYQ